MALLAIKQKLRAFSIIEAVVTMVLILTTFFITTHFLVSLNQSRHNIMRIKASSMLDSYIHDAFGKKDFSNKSTTLNGWPVATKSNPYKDLPGMMQVSFTIYKKDGDGSPFLSRGFLVYYSPSHE